jgi:hypothetical protein
MIKTYRLWCYIASKLIIGTNNGRFYYVMFRPEAYLDLYLGEGDSNSFFDYGSKFTSKIFCNI